MTRDEKLRQMVRREVASTLREILSDPDAGLTLRAGAIQRLEKSRRSKQEGRVKDLREVLKKYKG